ncbi:MAG: CHRD domain-containing protein [Gammaproteobacteria bacterium]
MKINLSRTLLIGVFVFVSHTAESDDFSPFDGHLNSAFNFQTVLSGAQEVTSNTPPNGVETDTSAEFNIRFDKSLSSADYRLQVRNGRKVTQAHLHCARAGVNGPVVVFLFGPVSDGIDVDGLLVQATLTNEDIIISTGMNCEIPITNIASLAFAARKGLVYANVHTLDYPAGEVRGQLLENEFLRLNNGLWDE